MSLSTIKWHERLHGHNSFPSLAIPTFNTRKKIGYIKVLGSASDLGSESTNAKRANLFAAKKEKIKLPQFDDSFWGQTYPFSEFLSHPSGVEAMLNTRALENFEPLGTDTYRCTLPKLKLLSFEAVPVMDLRVNSTNEDCMVEMLSCKFEGSDAIERQNKRFSAIMTNHMSWDADDSGAYLEVDVKLNITLEIYTRPFTMMPVSAVERPGNLMMQALLDKLVPLLLQQLLQDYDTWVHEQLDNLSA